MPDVTEVTDPRPDRPFAGFDVVVVATSLGGREALVELLEPLPPGFPAPVVVVQHVLAESPGHLPELLAPRVRLPVKHAEAGEPLRAAAIYVAPPSQHLLVGPDHRCLLTDEPPVNFSRPSADALFISAAAVFGARTLGVILTGRLSDGTVGAAAIRRAGGVVLAQDPTTCRAPQMPQAAIDAGVVDLVLSTAELAAAVVTLVTVVGGRDRLGNGSELDSWIVG